MSWRLRVPNLGYLEDMEKKKGLADPQQNSRA